MSCFLETETTSLLILSSKKSKVNNVSASPQEICLHTDKVIFLKALGCRLNAFFMICHDVFRVTVSFLSTSSCLSRLLWLNRPSLWLLETPNLFFFMYLKNFHYFLHKHPTYYIKASLWLFTLSCGGFFTKYFTVTRSRKTKLICEKV